jgi:cyclopropane fatty-acyl-phospholipid synthase-like methyltransferase
MGRKDMPKGDVDEDEAAWDRIFEHYVNLVTSPSGEYTFESAPALVRRLISLSEPRSGEVVIDMGAGWGKVTIAIAPLVGKVIAVEPAKENIEVAREEVKRRGLTNVEFVMGSFLSPGVVERVDLIISSAAFHHVIEEDKGEAIAIMYDLLNETGRVVMCDPFFFFDPEEDAARFNKICRYLMPRTLPQEVYKAYVEPHFLENTDYVYTWEDMKRYTPKEGQYYRISDLKRLLERQGFVVTKSDELAPFFGILGAKKA